MFKTIIVIVGCTVVNVGLFVLSRFTRKHNNTNSSERRVDDVISGARYNLDTAKQYNRELKDAIDACERENQEALGLSDQARELNNRARELCERSRTILQETKALLEDCTADRDHN